MNRNARRGAIAGGAGVLLLASTLSTDIIAKWEGKRNDPYRDIVGVMTVCYGETRVPMRRYTDQECRAMLEKGTKEYQTQVLRCTPVLAQYPYALAAVTSLSYNIGWPSYCQSTAARLFNAGDIKGGCNAINMWRFAGPSGNKREVRGLVNRRADEVKLCLTGLS